MIIRRKKVHNRTVGFSFNSFIICPRILFFAARRDTFDISNEPTCCRLLPVGCKIRTKISSIEKMRYIEISLFRITFFFFEYSSKGYKVLLKMECILFRKPFFGHDHRDQRYRSVPSRLTTLQFFREHSKTRITISL